MNDSSPVLSDSLYLTCFIIWSFSLFLIMAHISENCSYNLPIEATYKIILQDSCIPRIHFSIPKFQKFLYFRRNPTFSPGEKNLCCKSASLTSHAFSLSEVPASKSAGSRSPFPVPPSWSRSLHLHRQGRYRRQVPPPQTSRRYISETGGTGSGAVPRAPADAAMRVLFKKRGTPELHGEKAFLGQSFSSHSPLT